MSTITWTTTKGNRVTYTDGQVQFGDDSYKMLAIRPQQNCVVIQFGKTAGNVDFAADQTAKKEAVFADYGNRCDAWKKALTTVHKMAIAERNESGRHVREVEELSRNGFIRHQN